MNEMLKRLLAERANAVARARTMLELAEHEGRALTSDEERTWKGHMKSINDFDARIAEVRSAIEREAEAAEARKLVMPDGPSGISASWTTGRSQSEQSWLPSLGEYRALGESTGAGGGYLVPEQDLGRFFDRMAARSVVLRAVPSDLVIDTDSDELRVPKIGASAQANWVLEGAAITPSDPTFERITLIPHKLAAMTYASNEVMTDSNPSVRAVVQYDLERTMALKLDLAFLQGSGTTPEPRGLRNATGVTVTSLGANGATPTLDNVYDAISRIETDNGEAGAIFMHPRTWGTLAKLKDADTRYQLAADPSGPAPKSLFGVPVYLSGQISITETTGTSTDTSYIIVADMRQVVVARRKLVELKMSEHFRYDRDEVAIRAISRYDIGVVNEEGVEVITGVRP